MVSNTISNLDRKLAKEQNNFPLLIRLTDGSNRRWLCSTPMDLPSGIPFKIIQINCNIEIRHGFGR